MNRDRYEAVGPETEFEPGSRGRVLRNRLGIRLVRDMQQAESDSLRAVQEWAAAAYDANHQFTADDICQLHKQWLGGIYPWAGEYRHVNIAKGGFQFAVAGQVPRLMGELQRKELKVETPCAGKDTDQLVRALARVHAELILIHPFREGNGRCARLLAWIMAMQANLPSLDFSPLAGRGKAAYIAAIHASLDRNYEPMEARFAAVIAQTFRSFGPAP